MYYFDISPKGPPSTGRHSAQSRHIPLALPLATLRSPPQPLHTDTRPLNIHAYIPATPAPRHPPYMHIYRYTHIYIYKKKSPGVLVMVFFLVYVGIPI